MLDLLYVIDVFGWFVAYGEFDALLLKVPEVDVVILESDPLVEKLKIADFVVRDVMNEFFSFEVILIIPEGHADVANNAPDSLLFLAEGHGLDGHGSLIFFEVLRGDGLDELKVDVEDGDMWGKPSKGDDLCFLVVAEEEMDFFDRVYFFLFFIFLFCDLRDLFIFVWYYYCRIYINISY